MDPFVGSGTTVAVAIRLGRWGWGVDLSQKYLKENAVPRIEEAMSMTAGSGLTRVEYLEKLEEERLEGSRPPPSKPMRWGGKVERRIFPYF